MSAFYVVVRSEALFAEDGLIFCRSAWDGQEKAADSVIFSDLAVHEHDENGRETDD